MEITYYTDGVVWVTNQRVVFVETTYFLHAIKSIEITRMRSDSHFTVWLSLCLSGWLLLFIGITQPLGFFPSWMGSCILVLDILLLMALLPASVYIASRFLGKHHENIYCIKLRDERIATLVYASFDLSYLELVADSIEFALQRLSLRPYSSY
ncbi:MAG: hypothetical protein ABI670_09790 [Chloroflexota bacterium]